jgi:hypothetical protein
MSGRVSVAIVVLLMAGCAANEPSSPKAGPPIPYEDVGACPFEGCVYREWVANAPVEIHSDRTPTAPVAFTLAAGEKVTALGGVVVTTRPGRVEFDAPQDVEAAGGRIHVEPGQSLYLLTSQGEGFMKAWFDGRVYEDVDTATFSNGACAGGPRPCVGRLVDSWQFEWWVQVRNAAGQTGWTREPDKFDNKDALG